MAPYFISAHVLVWFLKPHVISQAFNVQLAVLCLYLVYFILSSRVSLFYWSFCFLAINLGAFAKVSLVTALLRQNKYCCSRGLTLSLRKANTCHWKPFAKESDYNLKNKCSASEFQNTEVDIYFTTSKMLEMGN